MYDPPPREYNTSFPPAPSCPKRKLLLTTYLAPGDTMMLTALVRDLHRAYPGQFLTDVDTTAPQIWENNPYITRMRWRKTHPEKNDKQTSNTLIIRENNTKIVSEEPGLEMIHCEYHNDNPASISSCNTGAYHFIHAYANDLETKLNLRIPITEFKGDIHLSDAERGWISRLEEEKIKDNFWIIVAGGKYDFTTKWLPSEYYQKVVDYFKGKILFVQCGEASHWHPKLKGVFDLIGRTDTRQFIRLVYHADGVLCPITFAMHLAAAVPMKTHKPKNRACVVIAGGREPSNWEQYIHHQYIHTNGALSCCDQGGCWHSRCQTVGDKDNKDKQEELCVDSITHNGIKFPKCMSMITPEMIIERIKIYYEGGAFKYNGV